MEETRKAVGEDKRGVCRFHSSLGITEGRCFPAAGDEAFSLAAGRHRGGALAAERGKGPE